MLGRYQLVEVLDEAEAARIGAQIAEAVAAAHEAGKHTRLL